jgi:hypothetical protein
LDIFKDSFRDHLTNTFFNLSIDKFFQLERIFIIEIESIIEFNNRCIVTICYFSEIHKFVKDE